MAWRKKKEEIEEIEEETEELEIPEPPKKNIPQKFGSVTKSIVVKDLPHQPVRKVKLEDGTFAEVLTVEECLEQITEKLDVILKTLEN